MPRRLWLSGKGSGLVIKAKGLPLLPDSIPSGVAFCVHSGGGRKCHISASGRPPQPSSAQPPCFIEYLLSATVAMQTIILEGEELIRNLDSEISCKSHSTKSKLMNIKDRISPRLQPCQVRRGCHIPMPYVGKLRTQACSVSFVQAAKSSIRESR